MLAQCLRHSEHTRNVSSFGVNGGRYEGGRSRAIQAWSTTYEITTRKRGSRHTSVAATQGSGNELLPTTSQCRRSGRLNTGMMLLKMSLPLIILLVSKKQLKGAGKVIFASALPSGSHVSTSNQRSLTCIKNASCKRVWKMLLLNLQPFKYRKMN